MIESLKHNTMAALKLTIEDAKKDSLDFVQKFFPKVILEPEVDVPHRSYLDAVLCDYRAHATTWGEKYNRIAAHLGVTALTNPM